MHAQTRRNFTFSDTSVGLILTIDRRLAQGSWIDCSMLQQNILLAATASGLTARALAAGCWWLSAA